MKKLITLILVLLLIFMVGSCWFNKKEDGIQVVPREEIVDTEVEQLYPEEAEGSAIADDNNTLSGETSTSTQTPSKGTTANHQLELIEVTHPNEYLSEASRDKILFDAPVDARYALSTAKELGEDKVIQLDMTGDKKIETITLGLDHPNGVRVLAVKNGVAKNLMNSITEGSYFDDYGDLLNGYAVQVTVLDLDNYRGKEVIISVGKHKREIDNYVFFVDGGGFNYVGKVVSKGAPKAVGSEIVLTSPAGQTQTYTLYQKKLVQIIKD